jgi:hypothetical protein
MKITKTFIAALVLLANVSYAAAEEFAYDSKGKRDPFIPLITKEVAMVTGLEDVQLIDDVTLEGIVWEGGGGSIAVLNGVIVREGEEYGSIKIEKESVKLFINEEEFTVNLVKEGE